MSDLTVTLDGKQLALSPAAMRDGNTVWVPLHPFCKAIGAEAKMLQEGGPLAVCQNDVCVPLNESEGDTQAVSGETFVNLETFGAALGLSWNVENGLLQVTSNSAEIVGLGIGAQAPAFTLPDLYTGEWVGPANYARKRKVFFMWASW